MSRAAVALFEGDLNRSLSFHPLALLILIQAAAVAGLLATARGRRMVQRHAAVMVAANGVILVAVWLVRWRLGLLTLVTASS